MLKLIHVATSVFFLLSMSTWAHAREMAPFDLIKSLLPENPIVVEAGAQFGEDTIIMSALWPKGTIYAFEPSPETYDKLVGTVSNLSNVKTFNCALSNLNGQFSFYLAGGASSLRKPSKCFNDDYFHADLEHPIVVSAKKLDDWAAENGIHEIDFLWFDMEGNEINALNGSLESLKRVKLIYTEVNFQRFWEEGAIYQELKAWLAENGFEQIWIEYVPDWHGNALFLNKQLK